MPQRLRSVSCGRDGTNWKAATAEHLPEPARRQRRPRLPRSGVDGGVWVRSASPTGSASPWLSDVERHSRQLLVVTLQPSLAELLPLSLRDTSVGSPSVLGCCSCNDKAYVETRRLPLRIPTCTAFLLAHDRQLLYGHDCEQPSALTNICCWYPAGLAVLRPPTHLSAARAQSLTETSLSLSSADNSDRAFLGHHVQRHATLPSFSERKAGAETRASPSWSHLLGPLAPLAAVGEAAMLTVLSARGAIIVVSCLAPNSCLS